MQRVPLEKKVLSQNDRIATSLRERFRSSGTFCVNLVSAPGSGKTTLLERTLDYLKSSAGLNCEEAAVLTGDIQTENDSLRLKRYGFPVKQITTGGTCHLDAAMVERHLVDWEVERIKLLFIENVGNLVCPSSYDLGEAVKVVLMSVTEGEDKPLKYPSIFRKSELLVLTKTDLLPHLSFDLAAAEENVRRVHPGLEIVRISCRDSSVASDGLLQWLQWLGQRQVAKAAAD